MFIIICVLLVLCSNINEIMCASEIEDGIEDILNPTTNSVLISGEQTEESLFLIPDDKWLVTALQDIAYYLRNHKFNEWDRRYYDIKPNDNLIGFYASLPQPSLSAIHWKVHKNCYKDFYQCIKYLYSVIETAPFTRNDDITTALKKGNSFNETSVTQLDSDCKKALSYSEKTGLPFDTPIEKFQWRTSASYYMCWYTMLRTPALSMLGESCDNFANCLDIQYGIRNHDPRSDDKLSFACAMYSFCPDSCCPLKYVYTMSQCYNSQKNPCFTENADNTRLKYRQCKLNRKVNQDLEAIIANKWNVSCYCREYGFEWKSQFGMCVDINECATGKHNCDLKTESCLNLPGTYRCICKWGYAFDDVTKKCAEKNILAESSKKSTDTYFSLIDNLKCFLKYIGF